MELEIPVTEFVYKALYKTYGVDSFDLRRQNDMLLTLTGMRMFAEAIPQPHRHPGRIIYLRLPETGPAPEELKRIAPLLQAGYFWQAEFRKLLFQWVRSQQVLADALRLPIQLFSLRRSIALFCAHYDINDDDYDYASMYRQLHRVLLMPYTDMSNQLRAEFAFEKSVNDEYAPCSLVDFSATGAAIQFYTYSRSQAAVVAFTKHIPKPHHRDLGHIKVVMDQINRIIIDGHTAK